MKPIFESNYLGTSVKVFSTHVEFNILGSGEKSILLNQIASISMPMWGVMKITIETTGGQKFTIPTHKKKEIREAIYKAKELH
jgi:hypothetical protein